jgi:hypothetical protein
MTDDNPFIPNPSNPYWGDLLYRQAIGKTTPSENRLLEAAYDSLTDTQLDELEAHNEQTRLNLDFESIDADIEALVAGDDDENS